MPLWCKRQCSHQRMRASGSPRWRFLTCSAKLLILRSRRAASVSPTRSRFCSGGHSSAAGRGCDRSGDCIFGLLGVARCPVADAATIAYVKPLPAVPPAPLEVAAGLDAGVKGPRGSACDATLLSAAPADPRAMKRSCRCQRYHQRHSE